MVSSSLILSAAALLFAENAASAVIRQRDCGFVWPASAGDTCASLAKDWVSQSQASLCAIPSLTGYLTGHHGD
jgi:hypothetical protein